ncbi:MAG: hypothetical protein AAF849_24720 [Bacteroidota bacterium]
MKIKRSFYSLLLMLVFQACSEPPTPNLLYADRQIVDSLYQLEYEEMVDSLDTDCEKMQEAQLELMVDSLLKVRLVEIIRQKERYQNNK